MDRRDDQAIAAFARVLQARRRELGLSQEELAHRAGMSVSHVSLLENRKRQPTLSVMIALARELETTLSDIATAITAETTTHS